MFTNESRTALLTTYSLLSLDVDLRANDNCPADDYIADVTEGCNIDWIGNKILKLGQSFSESNHDLSCTVQGNRVVPIRSKYPKGTKCTNVDCSLSNYPASLKLRITM